MLMTGGHCRGGCRETGPVCHRRRHCSRGSGGAAACIRRQPSAGQRGVPIASMDQAERSASACHRAPCGAWDGVQLDRICATAAPTDERRGRHVWVLTAFCSHLASLSCRSRPQYVLADMTGQPAGPIKARLVVLL